MKNLEKFLEFNGKRITVISADGTYWLALRPICEALNVDFAAQRKRLTADKILSRAWSKQTMHDASGRLQEMFCIKEKFVYGWLFSVQSDSEELTEYKLKCYEVLFDHFHGALTARMNVLTEQDEIALKIEELEQSLLETEQYKQIQELKKRKADTSKELKRLDVELKSGQLVFSFN